MKVVDFSETRFGWIPMKDNPAFGKEECYMLVKSSIIRKGIAILHIEPKEDPLEEDSVTSICVCHTKDKATQIANFLSSDTQLSNEIKKVSNNTIATFNKHNSEFRRGRAFEANQMLSFLENRKGLFLTFDEWFAENEDKLNIEFAETGADRELDFDSEAEFDKKYVEYCKKEGDDSKNGLS